MTWTWLLLMLKRVGFFLIDNWKVVLLAVAGAIIVFWILGWSFCSPADNGKLKEEILKDKIEANFLTNQRANLANQANAAGNNSNQALNNFNAVLNKDSSSYNGSAAEHKFCTHPVFCADSSCVDFRRRHPELTCKAN